MSNKDLHILSDKEWCFGELSDTGTINGMGLKRERDGSLFYGGWTGGLRNGFGMLGDPDGALKVGTWSEDASDELFLFVWPAGSAFTLFFGTMESGKPSEGTLICRDGRMYSGIFNEWQKDDFNGEGALMWANQRIYAGHWKKGGTDIGGVIRRPDREDGKLVGTLSNVRKGFEAKSWPQDSEKQFFYGQASDEEVRNADGILFYKGVEFFSGEMVGGQKSGYGLYRTPEGEMLFGNWENGSLHGQGISLKVTADSTECYVGIFKNSRFHGEGCMLCRKEGVWDFIYTGSYENGEKSGYGLLNLGDGQFYIGGFSADLKDGEGETVKADGSRSKMSWKLGVPDIVLESIDSPGPDRQVYSMVDSIEAATINSVDSFTGKDEFRFVGIRADENDVYSREIQINPGCDYEVRLLYRNDSTNPSGVANEVKLKAFYSKEIDADQPGIVSAMILSENTDTPVVWDGIRLLANENMSISYKIASARIAGNGAMNGHVLPHTLFSEDGVLLGTDALDGVLRAGDEGYVTFVIHSSGKRDGASPSFTRTVKTEAPKVNEAPNEPEVPEMAQMPEVPQMEENIASGIGSDAQSLMNQELQGADKKRKRSRISISVFGNSPDGWQEKSIGADVGQEVSIMIDFTNSASQQDLKITVKLPEALEYIPGSTFIQLPKGIMHKAGDAWLSEGMEFMNFEGDGNGKILFTARFFPSSGPAEISATIETMYLSMNGSLTVVSQ